MVQSRSAMPSPPDPMGSTSLFVGCVQTIEAVFHLDKNGDQAVLSYLPYEGGPGTELIAECALAIITRILRDLCGPEWALAEVSMPRRAPADRSPYQSCFRSDVRFDRDTAALVFPARLSSARLKGSDAAARCALKHSLQTAATTIDLDLIEDLRQVLRAELVSGRSSAADLARCYGIHKR